MSQIAPSQVEAPSRMDMIIAGSLIFGSIAVACALIGLAIWAVF